MGHGTWGMGHGAWGMGHGHGHGKQCFRTVARLHGCVRVRVRVRVRVLLLYATRATRCTLRRAWLHGMVSQVMNTLEPVNQQPGTMVLYKGESTGNMYLIAKGCIELLCDDADTVYRYRYRYRCRYR